MSFSVKQIKNDDVSTFIRPFDLAKAPLIRAGYDGNIIVIDIHHIIADGGSLPILLHELNELYMETSLEKKLHLIGSLPWKKQTILKVKSIGCLFMMVNCQNWS
ncbi:MAG: hypothetical protein HFG41_09045 [Coprococcus sp.]|nr:hypothetical protein [Coprococcus sp.]